MRDCITSRGTYVTPGCGESGQRNSNLYPILTGNQDTERPVKERREHCRTGQLINGSIGRSSSRSKTPGSSGWATDHSYPQNGEYGVLDAGALDVPMTRCRVTYGFLTHSTETGSSVLS